MFYGEISDDRAQELVKKLANWYSANKRDLPWRKNTDAYGIWVCEIMAQQTQIASVTPYYQKFMALFPTVRALAAAEPEAVLKAWEGLGYYARAHNLHKAAKIIDQDYGGIVPQTEKALLKLPGIGDYTAGAILSIAYGAQTPAVDGNVLRLFARLENNDMDIARADTKKALKSFLKAIMPTENTSTFTQSLMEMGALVCTPKDPKCLSCPLAPLCKARQAGREMMLPIKTANKPQKQIDKTVFLIINNTGAVLMRQRTEKLLQGMWEFYMADGRMDDEAAAAHLTALGATVVAQYAIGQARHVFTHLIWNMKGYVCRVDAMPEPVGCEFVPVVDVDKLAAPVAHSFFMAYLQTAATANA